jgi:hypothetical protein
LSGSARPPRFDPLLAGLLALEFVGIAAVTVLLILMRSAPEVIALYGMLMLAAAALPVWLIASMRAGPGEDEPGPAQPTGRHTSA